MRDGTFSRLMAGMRTWPDLPFTRFTLANRFERSALSRELRTFNRHQSFSRADFLARSTQKQDAGLSDHTLAHAVTFSPST